MVLLWQARHPLVELHAHGFRNSPGQDQAKGGERLTRSSWSGMRRDVRFGSKADIGARPRHVRFTPKSGHYFPEKLLGGDNLSPRCGLGCGFYLAGFKDPADWPTSLGL